VSALAKPTPAETALAEAFGALDAPSEARRAAWDAFARTGLPHRRMEAWRWSDVRRAASQALVLPETRTAPARGGLFSDLDPIEIIFVDGRFAWWPEDDPEADAIVREHATPDRPLHIDALPFGALSAALAPDSEMVILNVADRLARPIWLRFLSERNDAARLTRVGIIVEQGGSATVIESYEGGSAGFGSTFIEGFVHEKGRLDLIVLQDAAPDDVVISTADVGLKSGAEFNQSSLAFGAKLARLETHVRHEGEGARAVLDGAYLLEDELHADLTSVVTHTAPGCETRQTVKGAVRDRASGVFQGRFDVARGAQKTDARMGHHALLLSERASVNAKPELEIYADDVQCAHGNTAGALDPEQLFYLQARGLSEAHAKALITEAFIAEAFDRIADEAVRETLLGDVRAWLGRTA
jgi:Fe-S cluster assembly protein SufD